MEKILFTIIWTVRFQCMFIFSIEFYDLHSSDFIRSRHVYLPLFYKMNCHINVTGCSTFACFCQKTNREGHVKLVCRREWALKPFGICCWREHLTIYTNTLDPLKAGHFQVIFVVVVFNRETNKFWAEKKTHFILHNKEIHMHIYE